MEMIKVGQGHTWRRRKMIYRFLVEKSKGKDSLETQAYAGV
jgi:hypothetical protein